MVLDRLKSLIQSTKEKKEDKETYPSMKELEKEPKPEPKPQSKPHSSEETNADLLANRATESIVEKLEGMDKDEKYAFIMKKAYAYKKGMTTDQRLTETANMERDRAIQAEIKMLRAQLKEMELEDEQKAAFEAAVAEAHPDMVAGGRKKRKSKKRKPKKRRTKRRTKRR